MTVPSDTLSPTLTLRSCTTPACGAGTSIEALSVEADASPRAPQLIAEVFTRSGDADLRLACLRALQRGNRLSITPVSADEWAFINRLMAENS